MHNIAREQGKHIVGLAWAFPLSTSIPYLFLSRLPLPFSLHLWHAFLRFSIVSPFNLANVAFNASLGAAHNLRSCLICVAQQARKKSAPAIWAVCRCVVASCVFMLMLRLSENLSGILYLDRKPCDLIKSRTRSLTATRARVKPINSST